MTDLGATTSGEGYRATTLTSLVAAVTALYWIWNWIRRDDCPKMPGPRQHLFGSILNLLEYKDPRKIVSKFVTVSRQYGPVFKATFGPLKIVVLNSAPYIQKLCASLDVHHVPKAVFYEVIKPDDHIDGLISSKGQKWKTRRKLLSHIVEYKNLLSYFPILSDESRKLCIDMKTHFEGSRSSEPKSIQTLLYTSSLICVCDAAFGKDIFSDRQSEDFAKLISFTNRFMQVGAIRATNPWLILKPLYKLHPVSREMKQMIGEAKRIVRGIMVQYEEKKKSWEDEGAANEEDGLMTKRAGTNLLEDLYDAGLPFEGILEEVLTMIIAGFHTTGLTLQNVLFMLALHPKHQELCRQEVDALFENEELCPNGHVTQAATQHLKYLERCINETQRLLPVIFFMMRKIEAPLKLDNKLELPVGTNVAMFAQAIHMNPEYYPEPEKFEPGRWFPEEVAKRHPYCYLPFSAGIRKCIGYKFAMMELLILSARILRHFTWSTTDKLEDITFMPYITMKPEKPYNFVFKERVDVPVELS